MQENCTDGGVRVSASHPGAEMLCATGPPLEPPMTLIPTVTETRARARADLRMGLPVVLSEGYIVAAVETLTAERFEALRALGRPTLAITAWRARTLKARTYDGDIARIALPDFATRTWVQSVADPTADLSHPMKGPLEGLRDGPAGPHRAAIALAKAARLLPAALVVEVEDPGGFAAARGLTRLSAPAAMEEAAPFNRIVHARLPLAAAQAGRLHVFRNDDGDEEHFAVEIGHPDRAAPVLARLHSACFTGDVLGSLKCDCGPQLRTALAQMGAEGAGVLLYLNQEGRGIGLTNKMRAYSLQDQGFDTVDANHRLGFEDDERDFRVGAEILRQMGFRAVRLMTNNPAKIARMEDNGITVTERVALVTGETRENADYLETKRSRSGHLR